MSAGGFDLGDLLGGLGGAPTPPRPGPANPGRDGEKAVPLHGRKIDDRYYVRASDFADLLELNGLLPGIVAKLRAADS